MLKFITNPWGSGTIRGKQIAQYLNVGCDAHLNSDDTVVLIKVMIQDIERSLDYFKSLWLDVVDGTGCIEQLYKYPSLNGIAIGQLAYSYIRNRIARNKLVLIPEHHCNFERYTRNKDRDVRTVGAICYPGNFDLDTIEVKKAIESIGMEFKLETDITTREAVVDFYKDVDVQLCFRDWRGEGLREPPELKNPLKLENAGSFRIPTVAFPEPNFLVDFGKDCFTAAYNLEEVVKRCQELKTSPSLYEDISERAYQRAQDFSIDKIAPLYLELEKEG